MAPVMNPQNRLVSAMVSEMEDCNQYPKFV